MSATKVEKRKPAGDADALPPGAGVAKKDASSKKGSAYGLGIYGSVYDSFPADFHFADLHIGLFKFFPS